MKKRIIVYTIGLIVLTIGVTINTQSGLGVGSILVLPYFFTNLTGLSLPLTSFFLYIFCIIGQLVIVIKMNDRKELVPLGLQLFVSFLLSWLMGIAMQFIPPLIDLEHIVWSHFAFRLIALIFSLVLTGLGVGAMLYANLSPTPPDGIVNRLAIFTNQPIGKIKIAFDSLLITLTVLFALMTQFYETGIHIGTILATLLVGPVMSWFANHVVPWLDRYFPE